MAKLTVFVHKQTINRGIQGRFCASFGTPPQPNLSFQTQNWRYRLIVYIRPNRTTWSAYEIWGDSNTALQNRVDALSKYQTIFDAEAHARELNAQAESVSAQSKIAAAVELHEAKRIETE